MGVRLPKLLRYLSWAGVAEAVILTICFKSWIPNYSLLGTLFTTVSLNWLAYFVYLMGIYPFFLSPLRHLPHPKGLGYPLFGHGMSLFKRPPGQDFLIWMQEIPNDGIIMFRAFGYQPRLVLTNPKTLGEVLVQKSYDFYKPRPLRTFLRRVLGDGLIIVEGDEHRFQRKHIMPVFSFRHIKDLYPMMWRKSVALTHGVAEELTEAGEKGSNGRTGVVEMNHWANKVTMDIIGLAGLGREFNALKNSDDPLIQNYEELLEPTAEKLTYFAMQIIFPQAIVNRLPWKLNDRMRIITSNLRDICARLVVEKREAIKMNSDENLDILSVLIRSNNFSDKQLVDQLLTFLAAGHETTSSAFAWAIYLLATHPDIQTSLREEISSNIPENPPEDFDLATMLESLPILNGVCNETLRLYPTVPLTIRDVVRDTSINGTFVPRGTGIQIVPWAINRLPSLWGDDADQFNPSRWVDPVTGKPNNTGGTTSNYNILTFLHGPRSCIGKDFAKAELRCLVAAFVRSFDMEYADPTLEAIPHGVITTKPKHGMKMRLKEIYTW